MEKEKFILGSILGGVAFLIGDFDTMLITLLTLCCIDFVSGILKAVAEKSIDSRVMFKGGIRKVGIFSVVAVANLTDNALSMGGVLRSLAIGYYAANEGISVLENWGQMGLPLPAKLVSVLEQMKNEDKEN